MTKVSDGAVGADAGRNGGALRVLIVDDLDPNVVLIDIRLPDRSGIDVTRHLTLTHPDVRVVILSAYDDDDIVRAALEAGATGYLLKTRSEGRRVGKNNR